MAAVDDSQVKRLAILAAMGVGLHEVKKTAVARSRLVTWTYMGIGAVLVLLSGFGNDPGLLTAAGLVTVIMAMALYMNQRQDCSCCQDIEACEKDLSELVGNGGSLAEVNGTGVVSSSWEVLHRSQQWLKTLLREYGTRLAWVLVTAGVLALASGMAKEGGQMLALQIGAAYLVLSVLASDFRSVRTLLAWRKAVRSFAEEETGIFAHLEEPRKSAETKTEPDPGLIALLLEKLDIQGGTSKRSPLQLAVGRDRELFVHQLELLAAGGLVTLQGEKEGAGAIALTDKGREFYAALLALLEKALHIGF